MFRPPALAGAMGLLPYAGLGVALFVTGGRSDELRTCPVPDDAGGIFAWVEGGGFVKAVDGVYAEEGRPARLHVSPFFVQVDEVTNDRFSAFVAATGHVTEPERGGGSARFIETATPGDPMSWWRLELPGYCRGAANDPTSVIVAAELPYGAQKSASQELPNFPSESN